MEIKIRCEGAAKVPISNFKELQGDLKELSKENYENLKSSILKNGFCFPVFCWKDGKTYWIMDAHQRIATLKKLIEEGHTIGDLPTDFIHAKNKVAAKELLLQLNSNYGKITQDGLYEFINEPGFEIEHELLSSVDLPEIDMDKFNDAFFEKEEDETEDEVPDVPEDAVSILGDLWLLGNHRLLCGDSTKKEDVERLMCGEKADMVFTDPPYGVSYGDKNKYLNAISRGNRIQTPIQNDHMTLEETADLWKKTFSTWAEFHAEHSSYYICSPQGGDLFLMMMMMMNENKHPLKHCIIWAKNNHVLGRSDYNYKHEPILYGWQHRHKFYGYGDQKFSVWNYNKPLKNDLHPTMKPVELIVNAILNSTQRNKLVSDYFLGSGSTLIACEKTNRKCFGMELDEHYCDVIIKRWEEYSGKKAVHESGKTFEAVEKERS